VGIFNRWCTIFPNRNTARNLPVVSMSPKHSLLTAGGKIKCLRCTALSIRTGVKCDRPAVKSSKTQKCQYHGGRSTGPKTVEGKAQFQQRTRYIAMKPSQPELSDLLRLPTQSVETAMYLLEMTTATRGR
jgi:hypothetical protein